jgi:hypothetical protein
MAYQDDDRYGSNRWRDRGPVGGSGDRGAYRDRSHGEYGRGEYRGDPERAYRQEPGRGGREGRPYDRDADDRGFIDRAGDEVRSWFGDEEAQRRREADYRRWEREERMTGRRTNADTYGGYGERPGGGWGNQQANSWHRDRPGEPGWYGTGREVDESDHHYGARGRVGRAGSASGGPDTGDLYGYGRAPGGSSGFGAAAGGFGQSGRDVHDPHYSEWRQRQIDELDRDYHEYRHENQSRFEQEFATWRNKRQGQRQSLSRVDEDMEVVGSDGTHVGTVDKLRGDRIILARKDPGSGGIHHSIPCSWVESVDTKVTLNKTAQEARDSWRSEERSRALFEREDSGSDGPHALNRSFSGTYPDRDDRGDRKLREQGSESGARSEGGSDV